MMMMNVNLVLVGHYAGQDVVLKDLYFEKGQCRLYGQPNELAGIIRYMGRCYQAYPEGSVELEEAKVRIEGNKNGNAIYVQEGEEQNQTESVLGSDGTSGYTTPEVQDFSGGQIAESNSGETGVVSEGDRQTDSGLSDESPFVINQRNRLSNIVKDLDPDNDEHWTKAGLPKLVIIQESYGRTDLTRKDIEDVVNWNRNMARELKDEKELMSIVAD